MTTYEEDKRRIAVQKNDGCCICSGIPPVGAEVSKLQLEQKWKYLRLSVRYRIRSESASRIAESDNTSFRTHSNDKVGLPWLFSTFCLLVERRSLEVSTCYNRGQTP
nr:hypothetical protein CFP56_38729 [Quercus suber]